jgi:anti-sigma regulatory factor (Ser/Thr protein kinase)
MEVEETLVYAVTDQSGVGEVRRRAAGLGTKLGFDATASGRLALIVTESATNLVKHAGGGVMLLRPLPEDPHLGVEILALDTGPGIPSLEAALRDGFSSAGTAGTGLGAIRRAASEFDVYSVQGRGTALLAVLRPETPPPAGRRPGLWIAGLSVAKPGESVCGDTWAVRDRPDGVSLILVVDGLGHGPAAADVAREAVRLFLDDSPGAPAEMIERLHRGLRPTRGAAASVVAINPAREHLVHAGIGNVAGVVVHGARRSLVSHNGILGHSVRHIQEFTYPWPPGSTLILHSDGVTSRWDLDSYPGVMRHHPAIIAGVLYRDFRRPHDDATVVVTRGRSS